MPLPPSSSSSSSSSSSRTAAIAPSSTAGVPLALPPVGAQQAIAEFSGHRRLSVRQKKRWIELLLNWESKNSYAVFDEDGEHTMQVKEEGSTLMNLLKRLFLRTMRPFFAVVYDNPIPKPLLHLRRRFRFFFHRLEIEAPDGTSLGSVERRFSWLRRIYVIEDARGREVATLFGPILRPWTFEIRVADQPVGLLQKRWSGALTELFTDADNFVLDLSRIDDPQLKLLAFSATVLIDVVHFERSKHN